MALRRHHVRGALADAPFRRLFLVRFAGQYGDGVFQASLAGAVLFDPQRAGRASDVATAFAVLLLPYSVIGPFAGVLIDRWSRRGILRWANIVRAALVVVVAVELDAGVTGTKFYACALVVISLSRFVLAALCAALPHVTAADELVTANAVISTVGTVAAALGGGTAIAVRAAVGTGEAEYALVATLALLPYLLAAAVASKFEREALGPSSEQRRTRESPAEVLRGLRDGMRTIYSTVSVRRGLAALAVHRVLYGVWLVCTVLLYRNYFTGHGVFRAGLGGLSQVIVAVAAGGAIASLVTPAAYRRFGPSRWLVTLLAASALTELAFVLRYDEPALLAAALLLAIASQSIKISVDTLIQQDTDDAFRGRVFAVYDTLFNLAAVVAAVATACVLPEDGHSPASVVMLAAVWTATAAMYALSERRGVDTAPSATPTAIDHA